MAVLVLGATSPIARAIAREYAGRNQAIVLAARDAGEAESIALDLRIRYRVSAHGMRFDAREFAGHERFIQDVADVAGDIDTAIVAFGDLGNQAHSETDFEAARAVLEVNYVGAVSICEALAGRMTSRGRGTIIGISSVSGDRGRRSNYFYGSAKGGFTVYLQGLRARLHGNGVHVITVKPGFIDTPMTWGLRTRIPIASPESLAKAVVLAGERRTDVLYYPWFWRWIMLAVRSIPESRFKRLRL
ncbi:MAG: SDR family oxidoreductase [Chloroflexi bacterium]|nr:SDR family oxidoreductase [Chloroflexota bacterium]